LYTDFPDLEVEEVALLIERKRKRNTYAFIFRGKVQFVIEAKTLEECGRKLVDNFQKTKKLFSSIALESQEDVHKTFEFVGYENIFMHISNQSNPDWFYQMIPAEAYL